MWTGSLVLFISVLSAGGLLSSAYAANPDCVLRINELQLGANPNVQNEFIELHTTCPLPFDLQDYSLVLWVGNEKNGAKGILKTFAHFSQNCSQMLTSNYLVVGNQEMKVSLNDSLQFCSFSQFTTWTKDQAAHFYMDRGNSRTNAIALYKGVSFEELQKNRGKDITDQLANREKLQDILFYKSSGSMNGLKEMLQPEYNITSRDSRNIVFYFHRDTDKSNISVAERRSFGFCCEKTRALTQWPMGFKRTKPTPGESNLIECGNPAANFTADPAGTAYPLDVDRCDREAILKLSKVPLDPPGGGKEDNSATRVKVRAVLILLMSFGIGEYA